MATNRVATFIGRLGNQWDQYVAHTGQLYYVHRDNGSRSYAIPQGYEDCPNDTWAIDPTTPWPQWNNARTGRSVLINPAQISVTYLDDLGVQAGHVTITRVPESPEHLYRIPMSGILQLSFPRAEGFDVGAKTEGQTSRPDVIVFKVWRTTRGSMYSFDYLIVECKSSDYDFDDAEPQLREAMEQPDNVEYNVYGLLQCGLRLQFYKYENHQFQRLGQPMHIVNDVHRVQQQFQYIKDHPLPL